MENIILTNNKDLRLVGVKVGVLSTLRFELPLVSASATHVEVIVTSGNVHSAYTATFIADTKRWQCDIAASQFPAVGKQSYEIAYVLDGKQFWDGKGWIEIEDATTSGIEPQPRPEPYRYVVVSVNGYGADAQGAVRIPKTFIAANSPETTEGYMEGDIYFNRETGATWTLCNVQGTLTWVFNYKNYYTKAETDEAIDRVAAYYITYDAAGNPFPTYASLANAQTVYSGGQVRTPTRNDYCVVLADETHDNAEYRYIYAVADGETTGSWQPQFPVEGVMTVDQTVQKNSQNPVSGGGVWSALWGTASTAFSSLYDWCVSQLAGKVPTSRKVNGKALSSDVTLTGADIAVSGSDATKISAALAGKASTADATLTERGYSEWTIVVSPPPGMEFEAVGQPYYENSGWHIEVRYRATGEEEWVYATYDQSGGDDGEDSLHVVCGTIFDCTRTVLPGYRLGPDEQTNPNRDKPLASEAEAEALRTGKLDKSGGTVNDLMIELGSYNGIDYAVKLGLSSNGKRAFSLYQRNTGSSSYVAVGELLFPALHGTRTVFASTADIPYSLVTKTINNGAVSLDDRASNSVTVSATLSPNTLTINFPTAPTGKLRDFAMRLNIAAGVTAPEIAWPQGVTLENNGGEVPEIADGGTGGSSTILYFSESENNGTTAKFTVKGETLTAIAQA